MSARRYLTRLNSLIGEKVFILPLHCPRGYIFSPPETRRTFYWCLYIAPEVTSSRPQKHGGLLLFLACTRSTARRSLTCLYIAPGVTSSRPQKHEGLFIGASTLPQGLHLLAPKNTEDFLLFLACTCSTARRSFIWCLRSPKDDEDFKTLTGASNRRKTMRT